MDCYSGGGGRDRQREEGQAAASAFWGFWNNVFVVLLIMQGDATDILELRVTYKSSFPSV